MAADPWEEYGAAAGTAVAEAPEPWAEYAAAGDAPAGRNARPTVEPGHIAPGGLADRLITKLFGESPTTQEILDARPARPSFAGPIVRGIDAATGAGLTALQDQATRPQDASDQILPEISAQSTTAGKIAAGAANVPIRFANFALSPEGVAMGGALGTAPKIVRTLTGLLFGEEEARAAYNAPTLQEKISHGLGALAIGAGTAADALTKEGPKPKPTVTDTLFPEAPPDGTYETPTGRVTLSTNRPPPIEPLPESPNEPATTQAAISPNEATDTGTVLGQGDEPTPLAAEPGVVAQPARAGVDAATPGEVAETAKPRVFRGPADAFGSDVTPVASHIIDDVGGIVSKSAAKKAGRLEGNGDLWDGAGGLSHPTHNKIYDPNGSMPDVAAQSAFEAGLISDPNPDTLWRALEKESQSSRTMAREERAFSKAEAEAHAEWQDQVKAGEADPAIQLLGPDGEPALISKTEDGGKVELSLLDKDGNPAATLTHDTLDEALKSAHEQGFTLADEAGNGKAIFDNESPSQAGTGDVGAAQEAVAETSGAAEPKSAGSAAGTSPKAERQVESQFLRYLDDLANGEPVPVYHGSPRQNLTDLSPRSSVTHSRTLAQRFAGENGQVYQTKAAFEPDNPTRWHAKQLAEDIRSGKVDAQTAEKDFMNRPSETRLGAERTSLPKLRAGENQGDLLANQAEDLTLVGEKGVDHAARAAEADAAAKAKAEGQAASDKAQTEFPAHDWTGATEPIEAHATRLKLKAKKNGGYVRGDITLSDVAEFGQRILAKGLEFAKWSAEMIKHLGEAIKPHLKTVWDSLTGKNLLPGRGESGAVGGIGIRKRSALDAATGERSAKLQRSFADAERAAKEIRDVAPSRKVQGGMSLWIEAGGDQAKLAQWESAAKDPKFRDAAKAAQSLTPEQLAMAQKAQGAFRVLEQRGNQYDVLKSHRDNYVPHVWDVSKKGSGIGSSKLQDQFKFNKARTFENSFEGDQAGFKAKTLALGELLPSYLHEMNKVIADRQFVQDVQGAKASDGTPLVIPRGRVSSIDTESGGKAYLVNPDSVKSAKDAAGNPIDQSKYKVLDQPALHDWRWESKDTEGNPIYMKDDLAVHPELAKRLNAMTGQSAIRQWYNEPSTGVSVIPKAIAKGLDTAQAVMKREMFSLLAPFHQVQEGTHAVGHVVSPIGGLEDMSKPTPEHLDAMKHGLMLLPDRASSGRFMEGVGGKGSFLTQAARWLGDKADGTLAGKASNGVAKVVDGYQNYLFHQYIPALKFKTYDHILGRNMERYAKDLAGGTVTEADVKLLSAQQTNAAYGHLNYALLDRNPTMHHIMQLTLLAPDFLEARSRFVAQAAKSLIGEKAGHEQFRAIATLAAVQAGIAYTISKSLGDDWDPKRPFEVVHNGKSYMLRSVPEDLHRLLFQGPDVRREFVSARVNPTAQKVDQLRTGLNYRGEKTGAIDTMEELFANYIPITARSIPGVRELTATSKNNPISPLEQLAGSAGLKISRASPITKTHQLASEWMDAQKIERSTGSYPVSKFTPMRYALEDGDIPRAQAEWQKLVGTDGDEKKLREAFKASVNHPFTGSQARDRDFADSLKGKDRLIYDRAIEVRQGILDKFGSF